MIRCPLCNEEVDSDGVLGLVDIELPTIEIKIKKRYCNKNNMQLTPEVCESVKIQLCPDCMTWWIGLGTGDETFFGLNKWLKKIRKARNAIALKKGSDKVKLGLLRGSYGR